MSAVTDGKPRLLLVHEEQELLGQIEDFVEKFNWELRTVDSVEEARSTLSKECFDIIVTDLDLISVDGKEIISRLKECNPKQAVVVVSSKQKTDVALDALRSGAVDFFQKPLDQREFEVCISRIIKCVREQTSDCRALRSLSRYATEYTFTTENISNLAFEPPILKQLEDAGIIDTNEKLKISLAFQEALANSVEHGNLGLRSEWKEEICDEEGTDRFTVEKTRRLRKEEYAKKRITISSVLEDGKITFYIKDEGDGFDAPSSVSKPTKDELLRSYGRGLLILFGTMDDVQYSDRGREIRFSKILR